MSEFGCPQHPQSHWYWRTIDDAGFMACSICCTLLKPRERETLAQKAPEPVIIRSFALYRELASKTDGNHPLSYYAGGIGEEAGEMLELALAGLFSVKCSRLWSFLKKHLHHGHEYSREKMVQELGDGLWLLDQLAKKLGITLEEVAGENIQKLKGRYKDGKFSEEASRNRETEGG